MNKKKFTLFLVAIAMLLTVYFLRTPQETITDTPTNNYTQESKIGEKRTTLQKERIEERSELCSILGDKSSTFLEKQEAYSKIQSLDTASYQESLLENQIEGIGYLDTLCKIEKQNNKNYVTVFVLSSNLSNEEAIEIILSCKTTLGTNYIVSIEYLVS